MPTSDEITTEQASRDDIPENDVHKPWSDKDKYLEAQYKILRREGTEGLRYSVCSVRRFPDMADDQNTCIYSNVSSLG
jgi:helicase required for RNAi-mediated heterochromatin assembly 1